MTVQLSWQRLPDGQQLLVQPGYYYAVVAMVDVPAAKIQSMAAGYGLQIVQYNDPADPNSTVPPLPPAKSGYRYVSGQAVGMPAKAGATVPWSVPSPWSVFDSSTLVHAWAAPPPGQTGPLPTLSCPTAPSVWPKVAGGVVLGLLVGWAAARRGK